MEDRRCPAALTCRCSATAQRPVSIAEPFVFGLCYRSIIDCQPNRPHTGIVPLLLLYSLDSLTSVRTPAPTASSASITRYTASAELRLGSLSKPCQISPQAEMQAFCICVPKAEQKSILQSMLSCFPSIPVQHARLRVVCAKHRQNRSARNLLPLQSMSHRFFPNVRIAPFRVLLSAIPRRLSWTEPTRHWPKDDSMLLSSTTATFQACPLPAGSVQVPYTRPSVDRDVVEGSLTKAAPCHGLRKPST